MPDRTLLVADDDPGLRESLERTLTREGYRVLLASDGRAALERLQDGAVDLIVTDLKMPGLTGLELLRAAKAIAPDVDVILLTAFGTVEEAVKAMKDGAYDFLTKPFRREQLLKLIDKALERRQLIEKNKALQQRLDDLLGQGTIIGASPAFRRMMTLVEQVADSSATVLFLDEIGDLSPVTQPKILRVLQEGEFERLGATRTIRVDVRIVAATNQDLSQMVKERRFREDLFYRLNVITITVPPLRDRPEDISVLAAHFVRIYAPLAEVEARLLDETLRVTKGNKTLTARLLGIDPRTVSRKLERQEDEGGESPPETPAPA